MTRVAKLLFMIALVVLGISGCNRAGAPSGPGGPPATEVSVAEAITRSIIDYREFTGRTAAVNSVEIRPRVSGYLLQTPRSDGNRLNHESDTTNTALETLPDGSAYHKVILPQYPPGDGAMTTAERPQEAEAQSELFIVKVREGNRVQQGEPLFEIDPQPYRLAYLQAVGSLQSARAQLTKSRQDLVRQTELLQQNAISKADYDATVADVAEAAGSIENLRATVDRAYLDWKYTQLRSPIKGLVGRSLMTRGNLAVADTTVLTNVVTTDPIYVYFDIDENSVLDYRSRIQQGKVKSARDATIEVQLALANESGFPHRGVIDFVDNMTNPDTGNTLLRARFDNPKDEISPGLFARIRAPFTAPYKAVLIPTVAVASDQQGRFVMVVDNDNRVHRQSVVLGTPQENMTVVRQGLAAGQRVVVSGLQRVRDGMTVQVADDTATSAAKAASSDKPVSEPVR